MASFYTAATVLVLGLWIGGLSCQAQRRCVEVDRVRYQDKSSTVAFRSGMEIEFEHNGPVAGPEQLLRIGFFFEEDGKEVAFVHIHQDANNELKEVNYVLKKGRKWGIPIVIHSRSPFNVGKIGRVRLEYSGGLFQGVIWDKDRQRNKTWSQRAPTMGQGSLTIFARSPNEKYSTFVYWPTTCPPTPSPGVEVDQVATSTPSATIPFRTDMEDEFALDEGLDADPELGVEVDQVATRTPSATVPFRSGMEVEFVLDEGLDADPERGISIGFYIVEDGKQVANIFFLQYSNNELNQVKVNVRTDKWKNAGVISPKSPFNVGKIGRVRLEYSGGLFQGVIWDKDRQRNKTWSERAPTEGQGNLTIFARIPDREKYSSIIYWSITCPPAPSPASDTEDCISIPVHMGLLTVRAVMTLILLVIVVCLVRLERKVSRASEE